MVAKLHSHKHCSSYACCRGCGVVCAMACRCQCQTVDVNAQLVSAVSRNRWKEVPQMIQAGANPNQPVRSCHQLGCWSIQWASLLCLVRSTTVDF